MFEEAVPEESFLNDYYSDSFTIKSNTADIRPDFDPEKRLAAIRKYLKPGASILEIGASLGHFCDFLNERDYFAKGCDALASENGGPVQNQFVSASTKGQPVFDAVISYYVLEHIADARAWLAVVRNSLKAGGRLILEVPNFQTHPSESLNHEHLLHFTPSLLARCVQACGFKVLEIGIENASRDFGFVLVAEKTSVPAAVTPAPSDLVADNRNSYEKALKVMREREAKSILFSDYLTAVVGSSGRGTQVYFWGANEFATMFAAVFSSKTGIDPHLVDNSLEKRGLLHDGFAYPVIGPEFDRTDKAPKIFVLCSPKYNWQITSQIHGISLPRAVIIDAIKWQAGATVTS